MHNHYIGFINIVKWDKYGLAFVLPLAAFAQAWLRMGYMASI
jgi:hypothetical protein